jgi:hypothetical protein
MATYTSWQVEDELVNSGVDPDMAKSIAYQLGDDRLDSDQVMQANKYAEVRNPRLPRGSEGKQESNFVQNAAGEGGWAAGALASAKLLGGKGSFVLPFLGSTAGNLGTMNASNFYDRATVPQMIGDAAGSWGGGAIGRVGGAALGRALGGAAGAAVGTAAGAATGAATGAWGGPLGMLAGGVLGGWLLPKLMPNGSKPVDEDDGKKPRGWGVAAPLLAAGALAVPSSRRLLKSGIPDTVQKYLNPLAGHVDSFLTKNGGGLYGNMRKAYQDVRKPGIEAYEGRQKRNIYGFGGGFRDSANSMSATGAAMDSVGESLTDFIKRKMAARAAKAGVTT